MVERQRILRLSNHVNANTLTPTQKKHRPASKIAWAISGGSQLITAIKMTGNVGGHGSHRPPTGGEFQ